MNFISIQQSHGIACPSYRPAYVRTGFEATIAHKVDDGFAGTAKQDGKVKTVTAHGVIVEYKDGTTEGFQLGRRFGNAAGMTIPHELTTPYKAGEEFKAGDIITYHPGFFQPDRLNPKMILWMNGTFAKVALLESRQTHEDASSISQSFADQLVTRITAVKRVVVNFNQHIHQLVRPGAHVQYADNLCLIEDTISDGQGLFTEETLNTLKVFSGQSPRAKVNGTVEHIEVFYHGDKEDMSESLRSIADASDRRMAERRRAAGKTTITGQVDEGYRVDGEPLLLDTAVIVIYITHDVSMSVGDKGVFGNQLKTVISEVFSYDITTETGEKIDAVFGGNSVYARVVNSPFEIGTTMTVLGLIGKQAAKIYNGTNQK